MVQSIVDEGLTDSDEGQTFIDEGLTDWDEGQTFIDEGLTRSLDGQIFIGDGLTRSRDHIACVAWISTKPDRWCAFVRPRAACLAR